MVRGGIIGIAVDAGTGSTQELVPNPLQVTLTPLGGTPEVEAEVSEDVLEPEEDPTSGEVPTS